MCTIKNYIGRGIHDESLFKSFKEGGLYADLMNIVREDKTLDFEIRENYVNIYYEGCNIAKISNTRGSVQFDKYYFLRSEKIEDEKSNKIVKENHKPGDLYLPYEEKDGMGIEAFAKNVEKKE